MPRLCHKRKKKNVSNDGVSTYDKRRQSICAFEISYTTFGRICEPMSLYEFTSNVGVEFIMNCI